MWQSPHCLSSAGAPALPGSSGPGGSGSLRARPKAASRAAMRATTAAPAARRSRVDFTLITVEQSPWHNGRWRPRRLAASKRPRECAAVDEDVLARDESRVGAGEEGAQRAKFGRIAKSPDRDSRLRIGARRIDADAPLRRRACEARFLPVGFKRSGLDRVDRHVVAGEQPRRRGEERGQARARALTRRRARRSAPGPNSR